MKNNFVLQDVNVYKFVKAMKNVAFVIDFISY